MNRPGIRPLIDEQTIQARIEELGEEITRDYEGKNPLFIGILRGAFIFLADLARHIRTPCSFDFMAVSSYGSGTKSTGVVRILKDLDEPIDGRHVILIEDIVDTGLTLDYLFRFLAAREPASIEACVLLDKYECRQVDVRVRYTAFRIPNRFVVGYGLDLDQDYRHPPFVGECITEDSGADRG